ncbi:TolC family protein [Xanthovirga aplysinae]|uniref:TolC family protein n=1 Tax=Xanthovirga aplysinae TaxID=2529853 RepID=UPI0016571449|nr:TolC family protein [Xanthovirga aplysinae]
MRTKYILLFFLFEIQIQQAFGQLSIEECYEKARRNYPLIKQYGLIKRAKDYTLSNANKAYLPQFKAAALEAFIEGIPPAILPRKFNFIGLAVLSQSIWDGGNTKAKKAVEVANSGIDKANLEVSMYSIKERVNNLFFGILLLEEQLKQLQLTIKNLEQHLERTRIAVENGKTYPTDLDEIGVQILNIEQQMTDLRHNRLAYLEVLSAMIGESIGEQKKLLKPVVMENKYPLSINRPELNLYQNQKKLYLAQHKVNKASLYPYIGVTVLGFFIVPGIDIAGSSISTVFVTGVNLSWSIDGLYKNANNKKLTKINIQKVRVEKETFLFNTNLELSQYEKELEKYHTYLQQDQEVLKLKKKIKEAYEVRYENGVSSMTDLLDKINDENIAQLDMILHEIQYLMSVYEIKNTSGN